MEEHLTQACSKCSSVKPIEQFSYRRDTNSYRKVCKACRSAEHKQWSANNRDKVKASSDASYQKNKASIREKQKARYHSDLESGRADSRRRYASRDHEKRRETQAKYRMSNSDKLKAAAAEWTKENSHKKRASWAKREAAKKQATPMWADNSAIVEIYKLAADSGMEVDHVVPLNSKLVCGLHCEQNLQLLTPAENRRKSNRTWPDMP